MDDPHHLSPAATPPSLPPAPSLQPHHSKTLSFDAIVIIAAILCAIVCALGISNSLLQCIIVCSRRAFTDPVEWYTSRRINTGLKKKDMVALPTSTYASSSSSSSSSHHQCAICLVEYKEGDDIRVLPKCSHRFHVACIDTWLEARSSCPTCRSWLKAHGCMAPLPIVATV
ncbi:hypothetical protein Syun_010511 [Stephania yunnanensis]|uniref:RING-type domain-containing protein n=1 Tax=Stephania yunnanensis TaxID=152371 RepID=A0AAP0KGM7_9MAGN